MELDEVVARIFGRHKVLLIVCVVVGLVAAGALHWRDKPLYTATTQLVIGTSDPTSSAQAQALSDTVLALATGPATVASALKHIGADRNPTTVAGQDITAQSLGSSGVVALTVTDPDPRLAVALAGALAQDVVNARIQNAQASVSQQVTGLDVQIANLRSQIKAIDASSSALSAQVGSPVLAVANRARAEQDQLSAQSFALSGQLNVLLAEQANIQGENALKPAPAIVDAALPPAGPLPGRRLVDLAVGALLGLLVGIALAAAIESLRPSVVGRAALARSIQAPILAEMSGGPDEWAIPEVAEAAMHVEMAAAGADVRRVELIGGDRRTDLAGLAEAIGAAAPRIAVSHVDARAARRTGVAQPPVVARRGIARDFNGRYGLVVVVPSAVRLSDLDPLKDFVSISGWPLLGIIVCQPAGRRGTRVLEPATGQQVPA